MPSVFDMPIDELRDRADTVCELCAELLEVVPVLGTQPDVSDDGEERVELAAACDSVVQLVRGSLRRIGELLPGVARLPPGAPPAPASDAQLAELRRFLDEQPPPPEGTDRQPTPREELVRRARDAMERREIFERVAHSIGDLLDELRRLKLSVELRIGMPWTPPPEDEPQGPAN